MMVVDGTTKAKKPLALPEECISAMDWLADSANLGTPMWE